MDPTCCYLNKIIKSFFKKQNIDVSVNASNSSNSSKNPELDELEKELLKKCEN